MILRYDQGMNTHNETPRPMPGPHDCTCRYAPCHVCADPTRILDSGCPAHAGPSYSETKRLTDDADNRLWDPLVRYHPLNVGDEVRQDRHGITITGVVGSVDGRGNPRTAEGYLIGHLNQGNWWVRHTALELPTKPGAVIVPADGHERIEAVSCGDMYYAREAILSGKGDWHAAWRSDAGVLVYVASERVTPGTWKVDDK